MQNLAILENKFNLSDQAIRDYFEEHCSEEPYEDDFTRLIRSRVQQGLAQAAEGYRHYTACRMMYETPVITNHVIPLIPYIMGAVEPAQVIETLKAHRCGQDVIKKDSKGKETIDMASVVGKFVAFGRSIINKRTAAQNAIFNIYPLLKYESYGSNPIDRLRADVVTNRVEAIVEQMGLREVHEEIPMYLLYYGFVMTVPKVHWYKEKACIPSDGPEPVTRTVKEGIPFKIVDPVWFFYDPAHSPKTISSDSGCTWFGEMSVVPYSFIEDNKNSYFNWEHIPGSTAFHDAYRNALNEYSLISGLHNDLFKFESNRRERSIGRYSSERRDDPIAIHRLWMKVNFAEYGIGTYTEPVWCEFHVAASNRVIYAKLLPSCPGAYTSLLQMSSCELSPSMAHDLMQTDQILSTLYTRLIDLVLEGSLRFVYLNKDIIDGVESVAASGREGSELEGVEDKIREKAFLHKSHTFLVSFSKLADMGLSGANLRDWACQVHNVEGSQAVSEIMRLIAQAIEIGERMVNLAPQEQGQHGPHEISATESMAISSGGEAIYNAITLAIDKTRTAWKRILFEHLMEFGDPEIKVHILDRYPKQVIERAGFSIVDAEERTDYGSRKGSVTILGKKQSLTYDLYFASRDGVNRIRNTEAANALVQLLGMISTPVIMEALGDQRTSIIRKTINEVFRLTTSIGIQIEEPETEDNPVSMMRDIAGILSEVQKQIEELRGRDEVTVKGLERMEQELIKVKTALDSTR